MGGGGGVSPYLPEAAVDFNVPNELFGFCVARAGPFFVCLHGRGKEWRARAMGQRGVCDVACCERGPAPFWRYNVVQSRRYNLLGVHMILCRVGENLWLALCRLAFCRLAFVIRVWPVVASWRGASPPSLTCFFHFCVYFVLVGSERQWAIFFLMFF